MEENIYVGCDKDTAVLRIGFTRRNPETGLLEKVNLWFDSAEKQYEFFKKTGKAV